MSQKLGLNFINYRISRFFTGSYFRVLAFILVGELIFVEEKFADGTVNKESYHAAQVRFCLAHD